MKEKELIEKYPLTKPELVEARRSPLYAEGSDWYRLDDEKGHKGAFCWSEQGVAKLLKAKGVAEKNGEVVNVPVPAIVRQITRNPRILKADIRGKSEVVLTYPMKKLRPGNVIDVIFRGNRYYADKKSVNNRFYA